MLPSTSVVVVVFLSCVEANRVYQCSESTRYASDQNTCILEGFEGTGQYSFNDRRASSIKRVAFMNSKCNEIPASIFNAFKQIELLMMNKTSLQQVGELGAASSLKQLILNDNAITKLKDDVFSDASNLELLDLTKNQVRDISKFAFRGLTELKTLNLQFNLITELDKEVFLPLMKIHRIDLSNNALQQFDPLLFYPCKHLRELLLKENRLKEFRAVLEYNTLIKVIANKNLLRNFTLDTEKVRLANVSLTIQAIDNEIENFFVSDKFKVSILHLYKNNISKSSFEVIFNMKSLKSLSLSSNNIGLIDHWTFQHLSRLEELYLSRCNLFFSDPDTFKSLKRLKILDLGYNNLRFINFMDLRQMSNLETLAIHSNALTDIDVYAMKISLPNLRRIMLAGNSWLCSSLDRIYDQLQRASIESTVDFKTMRKAEKSQIHCIRKLETEIELEKISERLNYVEGKLNVAVLAIERKINDQFVELSDKFCKLEMLLTQKLELNSNNVRQSLCSY